MTAAAPDAVDTMYRPRDARPCQKSNDHRGLPEHMRDHVVPASATPDGCDTEATIAVSTAACEIRLCRHAQHQIVAILQ